LGTVKSDSNLIFNRLKTLNTVHRILLTGTPLNNNLRELFNLLNFLDKETFRCVFFVCRTRSRTNTDDSFPRDLADLEARFADLNEGLIQELHEMIKPYILRRIKADVLKLPPKVSQLHR
jgi:SNF2 family DNA or RNA helicase